MATPTSGDSSSPLAKIGLTPRDQYRVTPPTGHTLKIAHITDTHLGLQERTVYESTGTGESKPVKKRATSYQKFRGLLTTLQTLDPDVIIHTGDIIDEKLFWDQHRYNEFKSSLPALPTQGVFLYVRGNHDDRRSSTRVRELFDGWNVLSLDDAGPIPLANDQLLVYGRDYQECLSPGTVTVEPPTDIEESIMIGAFHQSIRGFSQSYDANTDLDDLSPAGESSDDYFDLLLLGHMHTNKVDQRDGCTVIDGGSALGIDTASTVGLLTFSPAGSHYQRFPLWVENT